MQGYLTTKEVAERLQLSVGRIKQFVAERRLPAVKVGHTNLVLETDLRLISKRKVGRPRKNRPYDEKK